MGPKYSNYPHVPKGSQLEYDSSPDLLFSH